MHAWWLQFLQRFDFAIKHTPGIINKVADTLSRNGTLLTLLQGEIIVFSHIKDLYPTDIDFKDIWSNCINHLPANDFHIFYGYLVKNNSLCIPHTSLRESLLKAHCSGLSSHFGRDKTLTLLTQKLFWPQLKKDVANWPQLKKDVANFVKRCFICKNSKGSISNQGLYCPLSIPTNIWEDLSSSWLT